LDIDAKPITKLKGCENGVDMAKYANENIYMFHNKTVNATLKIDEEYSADFVFDGLVKVLNFIKRMETRMQM